MADVGAESMVGGTTFHREMIQREISRALVLNLSGKASGATALPRIFLSLTAPSLLSRPTRHHLLFADNMTVYEPLQPMSSRSALLCSSCQLCHWFFSCRTISALTVRGRRLGISRSSEDEKMYRCACSAITRRMSLACACDTTDPRASGR